MFTVEIWSSDDDNAELVRTRRVHHDGTAVMVANHERAAGRCVYVADPVGDVREFPPKDAA